MTTTKISRTNANIIAELNSKGVQVLTNKAFNYFLEGSYNGKKISIGCASLRALISNGSLLTEYFGFDQKY